ncbi:LON peptidase substrate-binding domain-containing protein [Beijerinckia indica]|uniref:Peptidase S16 lon domain protein n=1 Tax=Beijerinckia indica subsp. indica (strain ATCC 9039 / DSM 1715 / NCIMB 8712) TaxID=395963 RepID=B2IJY7_BEII9|nr:LON peptidase substrate-binding domain-containing protein [Beijerinckia indica]ACB96362.1 peptidase S16 lon domain protein [Beijerinckia indica subsp. indica ATCC 9039]
MSINSPYHGPTEVPAIFPLFPLSGVLLLPRGQLPLNIFEPRYLAMVDDALKGNRIIGMIQPDPDAPGTAQAPALFPIGCAGRITQIAETGDGRYLLTLTGIARFRITDEIAAGTAYRQCHADFSSFAVDFTPRAGEEQVDRTGVLRTLSEFAEVNDLQIDWKSINDAPNEALVNALSMMSPFGAKEKQALLEAPDLKARADVLVAITERELARGNRETTLLQ